MIIGYVISLIVILYLIFVLFREFRKGKNFHYLLLNVGFISVALGVVAKILSFIYKDYQPLVRIFNASAVVLLIIIMVVLFYALLQKKKSWKSVWFLTGLSFVIMVGFGWFWGGYYDGTVRDGASVLFSSIAIILNVLIFYRYRQKGAFYFLVALIIMAVGALLSSRLSEWTLIASIIIGNTILALGIGGFGEKESRKSAGSIFGRNTLVPQKISTKLISGFGIILALLVTMVFLTYNLNSQIARDTENIKNIEAPLEKMVEQVIGYDAMLTGQAHNALLHAEQEAWLKVKIHQSKYNEIGSKMDNLLKFEARKLIEKSTRPPEVKEEIYTYLTRLDEVNLLLVDLETKAFVAMNQGNIDEAFSLIVGEHYHEYKEELTGLYQNWAMAEAEVTLMFEERVADNAQMVNVVNLFFGAIAVILGIVIASTVTRSIVNPIKALHQGTENIEKGDLDYKVGTDKQDEVGQLSRSFDKMTVAIKKSRAEVNIKVAKQTKEIRRHHHDLEEQQEALLNVLEDVEKEKERTGLEKEKIDAIVHSIGDAVFVINNNYEITLFNQIASNLSGYSDLEAIGQRYDKVLRFAYEKDGTINEKFIKDCMGEGKVTTMVNHTVLIKKDGSKIPVADSAAPLEDKDGKVIGAVVVFRDVTKEREIDQAKDEFLSIASHELRTPMTAIMGNVDMVLKGQAGKISDEVKEYLEDVAIAAERLIKLVNDMLDVSRVEVGRMKFRLKEVDMNGIIKTLVKDFQSITKAKNITIKYDQKEKMPKVWGDEDKLTQVVLNVVGNAVKFTEKGSVTISTEVKDEMAIVRVKDTGPGIGKEDMNKLFKKFQQIHTTRTLESKGTGLGLYICQQIISKLGGEIWADSEGLGKGSTFSFSAPVAGSKKAEETIKVLEKEAKIHPDQK